MSEYGYIPEAPEQSFGNNKGIFTPKDIYDLTRADKYTNYGQLELIETQTFSTVSAVDFTSIQESTYNVHFLTYSGIEGSTASNGGLQFYESGVLRTGGYQDALQYGTSGGSFGEEKSTSRANMYFHNYGTQQQTGAYAYIYNAGDSSKYTFSTWHSNQPFTSSMTMFFGSGVMPYTSTVDGIRINVNTGTLTGQASLYGIKEYS
jgi:hypothetical protein